MYLPTWIIYNHQCKRWNHFFDKRYLLTYEIVVQCWLKTWFIMVKVKGSTPYNCNLCSCLRATNLGMLGWVVRLGYNLLYTYIIPSYIHFFDLPIPIYYLVPTTKILFFRIILIWQVKSFIVHQSNSLLFH